MTRPIPLTSYRAVTPDGRWTQEAIQFFLNTFNADGGNDEAIAALNATIAALSSALAAVTARVTAAEAGILANAADIATNAADIATNTADIAANVIDIATNTASNTAQDIILADHEARLIAGGL
jgi:polyribonucleotide nucleotidyltransferase